MEWPKLLSTESQFKRDSDDEFSQKYEISAFENDQKAIVSSAAFRRLQDKTQVFPLDKSDFVRTRLTHSIEVSTISRQLGIMITNNRDKRYSRKEFEDQHTKDSIISVLSCAGLLHDLGNPPFGHFGEDVIREWFKNEFDKNSFTYGEHIIKEFLTPQMVADLCNFEGNAQSLRILSKGHDTNLTYCVLSALIKYPTDSENFFDEDDDVKRHKVGYFAAEKTLFEKIGNTVGTQISEGVYTRHPLAYLMEAADDIAYSLSDVEDALKKKKFTLNQFIVYFHENVEKITDEKNKHYSTMLLKHLTENLPETRNVENDFIAFQKWADYARKWFMYTVAFSFSFNYKKIMTGSYKNELFDDCFHKNSKKILKDIMKLYVYDSSEILKLELSANKIITSLLNDFIYAVLYWNPDENKCSLPIAQQKLIHLIPENYKNDYRNLHGDNEAENLYLRFLMVTDYISGMTDSYAKNLYRELNGID